MKIVLDTNVLIAALIARGFSHQLLEHCALRHTLFTSDFILEPRKDKQRAGEAKRISQEELRLTAAIYAKHLGVADSTLAQLKSHF